jgi:ABC-2 type transport system permease protein
MSEPIRAIVWAQWKTLLHSRTGGGVAGTTVSAILAVIWFGLWGAIAAGAGIFAAQPWSLEVLGHILPSALLMGLLLWQVAPVLLVSQGASLDLKKLLVYPVPQGRLFALDVLLRVTSAGELILMTTGVTVGLLLNSALRLKTAPLAMALFAAFNLLLAAGVRLWLERLLARKRLRELLVILLALSAALPQLLMATGLPAPLRRVGATIQPLWSAPLWPWSAASRAALGESTLPIWASLATWTVFAWAYGRWQFAWYLRLDQDAGRGYVPPSRPASLIERLYRLPSRLLPDPLAALVEKEIRSLARSPHFRLVFIMGFTFGIVLFVPALLKNSQSALSSHRLTLVSAYSVLLLGDVVLWNIFGFDRQAAAFYFLAPHRITWTLLAKNLAAALFVALEVAGVAAVWALMRLPLTLPMLSEAASVTFVLCLYLLGAGNLTSVAYPRAASPERATGASSSGRTRLLLLVAYPVLAIPVLLAFLAGYAFDSRLAFYLVLSIAAAAGVAFYLASLGSAASRCERLCEGFLGTLSQSTGPVSMG